MSRRRLAAVLTVALGALASATALAADHNGSLSGDGRPFTWTGEPLQGVYSVGNVYENVPCDAPGKDCDDTLLKVTITPGRTAQGTVSIDGGEDDDLDLYLYESDATGKVGDPITSSAGGTAQEQLSFDAPSGYYLARVVAATAPTGVGYTGKASVLERPPPGEVDYGIDPANPGAGNPSRLGTTTLANDLAPTSIARPLANSQSRVLRGTARDRDGKVAYVDVGLVRITKRGCSALRANGRFRRIRKCPAPPLLRAKGTTRWHLTLPRVLPKGTYAVFSRATDNLGRREGGFNRRNRVRFVVK